MPLLILLVGVGLDLGWYYLTVSRLQNAADAAVLAGARAFVSNINKKYATSENEADKKFFYKYDSLIGKYPANNPVTNEDLTDAENAARNYVVNNLGKVEGDSIIDAWNKGSNPEVEMTPSLYRDDSDNFYYVVELTEKVKHLFLGGKYFEENFPLNAPVVAAAILIRTPVNSLDEIAGNLDRLKNGNVIVGNWEVQNYYRDQKIPYEQDENGKDKKDENGNKILAYIKNEDGSPKLDADGNKISVYVYKNDKEFATRFNYDLYTGAWNHFQDFHNHYKAGDFYRTGTVIVKDDVKTDDTGKIISYGEDSSVAATSATINNDTTSAAYNPEQANTLKTHKKGITEKGTVGLPYTADRLDSINIDFKPEVTFSSTKKEKDAEGIEQAVESASKK